MFSKLAGNLNVKQTLGRLLDNDRLPNSLLFAGPDGIGKRQFALETARAVLCIDKTAGEACGVCAVCRRIDKFTFPKADAKGEDYDVVFFSEHPDVGTVIPFNRTLRVGSIRALEVEANFRPFEAKSRFFIVNDADKMNDAAANALLKTLEEPPLTSHIFLITSRPDSLLATIRSRCQTLRFGPVSAGEIEEYLINDRALAHHEAALAARLSRGSIARAVSLNVEKFKQQRGRMFDVVRHAIATGDRAAMLRISEEMNDAKNKDNFGENLEILESLIHDVWSVAVSGDRSRVVNTDLADEIEGLAQEAHAARLPQWLKLIREMRLNFIVNINRKAASDSLFLAMAGA
ncbi:MAG TPA: DNA polymerase III subunit delta' [Pyrinomonadaceae bacterium]|jgi:DNA polymerase-3 subunit delta'|nr:DNA polymerase III subunit delta' [Pyrinomonadaceae bacterium]